MKSITDLILKIALAISIIITAIVDDVVIEGFTILLLGLLTILTTIINFKMNRNRRIRKKPLI